ncbi:hypothetical protein PVMG_05115 [Plasmodium vivax Mauritania I]|uniref:Uncharacterized protein n=1 Tax=Plasmodium vivax Mauritania I TaxID=1035515 RepID=A0A0J9TK95_PLAVI|nr:hypothetical protein PVMG_05115 [Plasmodium vivax Mauritania I]
MVKQKYFIERKLGLPSDRFYQKLNLNYEDVEKDYAECNEFSGSSSKYKIKRICTQLLKYLESSEKIKDKENSAYDDCLLLNYWIYGEIVDKYYKANHNIVPAYGELQRVWNGLIRNSSKTLYYNKCEPDFHIVIKDDWKKRKELYGYCVDYNTIKGTIPFYDTYCKEIYMYLKEKDALYKEYSEYCIKTDKNKCPDFFTKCKDKDPNTLLSELSCYGEMQRNEVLALEQEERPATADKAGLSTDSQTSREGTNPVTNSGHVLLGVVVTSMTSGALYKVKTDFIITY